MARAAKTEVRHNYNCYNLENDSSYTHARFTRSQVDEVNLPAQNLFVGSSRLFQLKRTTAKLRLDAMRALVVVLKSLFESIEGKIEPNQSGGDQSETTTTAQPSPSASDELEPDDDSEPTNPPTNGTNGTNGHPPATRNTQQSIVEIYDSKKKLKAQQEEAVLRFNHSPKTGIKYAAECGLVDGKNPTDVARYLIENKDNFDKTQIGDYLGREREYQGGFCFQVLHSYCDLLDFTGLVFDDAIRHYLAGFRLPGEAQKIDRIMEKVRLLY